MEDEIDLGNANGRDNASMVLVRERNANDQS
jgi:hypothetical protein